MSVVIIGGNERMVRQYIDLCKTYRCRAKVYTKMHEGLRGTLGSPDLLVLFTSTTSHKMVQFAFSKIKGDKTAVARSHSSSMAALRGILDTHAKEA